MTTTKPYSLEAAVVMPSMALLILSMSLHSFKSTSLIYNFALRQDIIMSEHEPSV